MYTADDFKSAIADRVNRYPAIAPLYKAGDPRVHQPLDAIATMLAMLSSQIDVAVAEPFSKSRDSTVLADSAMRGIIPKATPARVRLLVENRSQTSSFQVESGRTVIDTAGFTYQIETAIDVPAGSRDYVEAMQMKIVTVVHAVTADEPFYSIEIPKADDGSYLSGIGVKDKDGDLIYSERYVNVLPDDRIFHVEVDEHQRIYVRFGYRGIVGVQPLIRDRITLTIYYSAGENSTPVAGSPFSFENILSPLESNISISLTDTITAGANPISLSVLRDLSRYPSVYNHDAVFLGEFDFLVRRNFPTLQFLSIWNETDEESARGSSLDNINTLFVACLSQYGGERVLPEGTSERIIDADLTPTQVNIKQEILNADDSYRVKFVTPVRSPISMTISATVATSYVSTIIVSQIKEVLLSEFGQNSAFSRRGQANPLYQRVYSLLKEKVLALSGVNADLVVSIENTQQPFFPELWRYVDSSSLSVTVNTVNITVTAWRSF
ncbi:conserved hypothetical protein [Gammaproteobacteria bacterium]